MAVEVFLAKSLESAQPRHVAARSDLYLVLVSCGQFVDRIPCTRHVTDRSDVTEGKTPKKSVVAATLEKAKTYILAEP